MARQPRLIVPDVAVHVIQRGNNRTRCFADDADHLVYLALLRELSQRIRCAVHAYCLMTNHVHLLVTPNHVGACMGLMKELGQRYVQYFNRRHERTGTLWEGRYRSCIAQSAEYVLACYRYIELNPVRAGMADHPTSYRWSSHAVNSGQASDPMIVPHVEFLALGLEQSMRQRAYCALIDKGNEQPVFDLIRKATNGGYPLVSDSFKAGVLATKGRKLERDRPGPRPSPRSGSDPDLFSGGGAS
jgi:putative transposase